MDTTLYHRLRRAASHNLALLLSLAFLSSPLTGCDDWLDVSPKTQIKSDDNFSSEQGFKDALTGVYLLMTDEAAYGKELSFGMLDAMAQYYTGMASNNTYQYAAAFDYKNADMEARINKVWSQLYTAIANDNELIDRIDAANKNKFTGRNYRLIRGEAYGLRAFLHFDLLRMWGDSYATNPSAKCIPYVKTVTHNVTGLSTVEEVLNNCLADLAIAEAELSCDPVITNSDNNSSAEEAENADASYERNRTFKMNYYAVKLLQARINLYMGNLQQAMDAAEEVIGQITFTWTPDTEINTAESAQRNRIFSEELIFCLYDSDLRSRYSTYFTSDNQNSLIMNEQTYQAVYELFNAGFSGDYRYAYQNEELDGKYYSTKYMQPTSGNISYMFRIPLMRLSEAYYIAAECLLRLNGDVETCVSLLNVVRSRRNLPDPLDSTLSPEDAEEEIRKEYVKEFFCEGQLYYYYKRLAYERIPVNTAMGNTVSTTYATPVYKFPLPDDEIEFGGRDHEK